MIALDRIDRQISEALQNNARISNKELAAHVDLAPSACLMRVRKLEAAGVIRGYHAELAPAALGLGLQALISVQLRLHVRESFGSIGEHLRSLPESVAVYCLGGSIDFLVHVMCRDVEHLRVLTNEAFTSRPEVARIETSLVFSFARSGFPVGEPESPPRAAATRARARTGDVDAPRPRGSARPAARRR
jgi:DNA-binding Lrp family transcriptional regulator